MTRQPPDDLTVLHRFFERWSPYEDRKREISADLKELFAELKGNGLTPKSARIAFAEFYRMENQTADQARKRDESDEEVELYLSALARVRESGAEDDVQNDQIVQTVQTEPATHAAAVDGEGGNNAPALPVDTIHPQPETAGLPEAEVSGFISANSNLTPNQIPVVARGVKVEHRGTVGTR